MLRGCQTEVGAEKRGSAGGSGCASSHAGTQLDRVLSLECVGSRSGTEGIVEGMFFSGLRYEC